MWLWMTLALAAPAMTPSPDGPFAPSNFRLDGAPERMVRADDCAACHPAAAAEHAASAHAHASLDNPWYLSAFLAVRQDEGEVAVQHCAGCHDPALLVTGGLGAAPGDPLTDVGVTCLVCHAAADASPDGNGSLRVDVRALPDPRTDVAGHRARMLTERLRGGEVCQGCHRGALVPEMGVAQVTPGFDDWGTWQGSGWAGPNTQRYEPSGGEGCVSCHGHTMVGGRTAITALTGALPAARATLQRAATLSATSARVDGAWVDLGDGFAPAAGAEVVLELAVRNVGAGHRFPGGLGDVEQTWVEVTLGTDAGVFVVDGPQLRSLPLQADGTPERLHRPHKVVGAAFDHTVPPGEAQSLRVRFTAPGGPIAVDARLLHRPHRPELEAAACAVTTPATLDGCAPSPTTVVATLGPADADAWYAVALARSHGPTESLPDALAAVARAEALGLDPRKAAVIDARILGRLGRVDDALASLAPLPPHPSVHAARARALDAVWRWDDAADAWAATAVEAPLSVEAWVGLARAEGARGHAAASLRAAQRGLRLAPRHPELLRSQALALSALGAPDADAATAAWLLHRPPDDLVDLRLACDRRDAECRDQRGPFPTVTVTVGSR